MVAHSCGRLILESCTLAISMVNSFPPNILVKYPDTYPTSDVGMWKDILAGAVSVQRLCLGDRINPGMPKWTGWSPVGMFVPVLSIMFCGGCFSSGLVWCIDEDDD